MKYCIANEIYTYTAVVRLDIHAEIANPVLFNQGDNIDEVLDRNHQTKLTSFFNINSLDSFARTLLYRENMMKLENPDQRSSSLEFVPLR